MLRVPFSKLTFLKLYTYNKEKGYLFRYAGLYSSQKSLDTLGAYDIIFQIYIPRVSPGLVITIFFFVLSISLTIFRQNREVFSCYNTFTAKLTLWLSSQSWNWVQTSYVVGENWLWTLANFIQAKRILSNQKNFHPTKIGPNYFFLMLIKLSEKIVLFNFLT